ncbi:MAG TPA: VOC family protein [Opitutaceae bacterium]|nr:VOC family protein [Opitutaceae bacterium]
MKQAIGAVSLLVRDYGEAVDFYTRVLRFEVVQDVPLGGGRRWILLGPPGSCECRVLLSRAKNEEEAQAIGRQAGGRVFLFLHTDDFDRDYREMRQRGVRFVEEPRREEYGTVAVFEDLYGNKWDLLMPAKPAAARPASQPRRQI